jgi:hypothetical protein
LEQLDPSQQLISFYGGLLHAPALNPVEENIHWRREIVQLNGSSKGSGSEAQCIALGPSPGAPFDDYRQAERKKFLSELPLQSLDLRAARFVVEIQRKSVHPFIRSKTNCPKRSCQQLGMRGFA